MTHTDKWWWLGKKKPCMSSFPCLLDVAHFFSPIWTFWEIIFQEVPSLMKIYWDVFGFSTLTPKLLIFAEVRDATLGAMSKIIMASNCSWPTLRMSIHLPELLLYFSTDERNLQLHRENRCMLDIKSLKFVLYSLNLRLSSFSLTLAL